MDTFDLGIAYDWVYDEDFLHLVEQSLQHYGLTTYIINSSNIDETLWQVQNRKLIFETYLDRAWDIDTRFELLGKSLQRRRKLVFNSYKNVLHAIDKASMHLEFMTAGLDVPYSIIIPPHSLHENLFLSVEDLAILGRPFIIKPCNTTGGGIGVVTGAETLKEVFEERITNSNDKYLIQQKIYPKEIDGRRFWFRCFWAFNRAIAVWWNDKTHLYEEIQDEEWDQFNLRPLLARTRKIARITQLDFFSTEIAVTNEENFVIIDYVNDQCDMRLKSGHFDGVPDSIVEEIIYNLKNAIVRWKRVNK